MLKACLNSLQDQVMQVTLLITFVTFLLPSLGICGKTQKGAVHSNHLYYQCTLIELGLLSHFYRNQFSCCPNVRVALLVLQPFAGKLGSAAPYLCSMHQLPGCEYTMNWSHVPLRCENSAYRYIWLYAAIYTDV